MGQGGDDGVGVGGVEAGGDFVEGEDGWVVGQGVGEVEAFGFSSG